ncbi:MAG: right-handed parallel beta-helix repeat-containing protein, partial [Thermoplasmata archaeon]|nr:right-handed parallel beta-helix repeat-containing protein [Thermoplasmata archaeon]
TLPFYADYLFWVEDGSKPENRGLDRYDGSSWIFTGNRENAYIGWSGNTNTEICISLSDIGANSSSQIKLLVFAQWEDAGNVWNAFPRENPVGSGSQTFTTYWIFDSLGSGVSPNKAMKGTVPFAIDGNSELAQKASEWGWTGDGSETNPYVIENYRIDANGGTYCLWIKNTDAYFTIRNCTLWNATSTSPEPYGTGIALKNVTNGRIESCKCSDSRAGIYVYGNSESNILTGNEVRRNYWGVCIENSVFTTINNNIISQNTFGVYLYNSNSSTISYNWITNNSDYGAYLTSYSSDNTIHHNNFIANNGASKGLTGNCQAYDTGGNRWYISTKDGKGLEGNYWSNWDGIGDYPIDGGTNKDPSPFDKPVSEFSQLPVLVLVLLGLLVLFARKRKH